jgi:3-oxoacyl-[acyl-carrier-protein] synthase-3
VEARDVDGIVFVSQTPDHILPATSVCLQHRLGLPTSAPAFDIPYGCSGYIYGLFQAALLIHAGACRNVLVCAGDTISRFIHPKDRSVRMVFGDAGTATLVSRGTGTAAFTICSDGSGAEQLIIPAGGCRIPKSAATAAESVAQDGNTRSPENIFMNGAEIMNFALREVPLAIDAVLALAGWEKESVGIYGLHQANKFMVDYLAKKARLPKGSAPVGMARTGNSGPASIPQMLTAVREEFPPERRARAVFCGFGVGLSWGACAVELGGTVILPPVEMDAA